ncbi:hypothetical protein GCM10027436_88650 [Actinophytocola sediminis]
MDLPDQAVRVASWVGWHLFEITAVTGPALIAVTLTPWAWLVAGLTATGWTVHEIRTAHQRARNERDLSATGPANSSVSVPAEAENLGPARACTGVDHTDQPHPPNRRAPAV